MHAQPIEQLKPSLLPAHLVLTPMSKDRGLLRLNSIGTAAPPCPTSSTRQAPLLAHLIHEKLSPIPNAPTPLPRCARLAPSPGTAPVAPAPFLGKYGTLPSGRLPVIASLLRTEFGLTPRSRTRTCPPPPAPDAAKQSTSHAPARTGGAPPLPPRWGLRPQTPSPFLSSRTRTDSGGQNRPPTGERTRLVAALPAEWGRAARGLQYLSLFAGRRTA